MWNLAYKNIMFRKTRSLLSILGILAAIQLYIIMSSVMDSFDIEIQKQISGMAGRIVIEYMSEEISFPPLTTEFEENLADKILQLPGIDLSRSSQVLFQTLIPAPGPNMPPSILAVGIEPGKEAAYFGEGNGAGERHLMGEFNAILGVSAAEHYGVGIGDSLMVRDATFTVTGILEKSNWLVDNSIMVPLTTAQEIFARPGLVSAVMMTASNAGEVKGLAVQINADYPKLKASSSEDLANNAEKLIKTQRTFFTLINNTAIIIAIVVVTIVMVMSISERRKEIGTLKAIGASRRTIIGVILMESVSLSLLGGILALPVSIVLNGLIFDEMVLNSGKWLETIVVSVVIGLFAALWPAWAAQRVNPLESLRYE